MKRKVICLMGQTGVGKSELAIRLSYELPIEIISVDSAMVYRGLDIGTAKPSQEQLKIVPHHLINIREPNDIYSAGIFYHDTLTIIEKILLCGKIPVLVGGTMFYYWILQYGINYLPPSNKQIREKIQLEKESNGVQSLFIKLQKIDKQSASRISSNDYQRIQRALEVYELTNVSMSTLHKNNLLKTIDYEFLNLAIVSKDRNFIYQIIEKRFLNMIGSGFIDEVRALYNRGNLNINLPSIRTIGYSHIWKYLLNQISYEDMIQKAVTASRHLAKRQLTWLKKWNNIQYLYIDESHLWEKLIEIIFKKS